MAKRRIAWSPRNVFMPAYSASEVAKRLERLPVRDGMASRRILGIVENYFVAVFTPCVVFPSKCRSAILILGNSKIRDSAFCEKPLDQLDVVGRRSGEAVAVLATKGDGCVHYRTWSIVALAVVIISQVVVVRFA